MVPLCTIADTPFTAAAVCCSRLIVRRLCVLLFSRLSFLSNMFSHFSLCSLLFFPFSLSSNSPCSLYVHAHVVSCSLHRDAGRMDGGVLSELGEKENMHQSIRRTAAEDHWSPGRLQRMGEQVRK